MNSFFKLSYIFVLPFLLNCEAYDTRPGYSDFKCDFPSQNEIDFARLTGHWYGVEIVQHLQVPSKPYVDTCIKIEITQWQDKHHLTLMWREGNFNVNYTFYVEHNRQGHWQSQADQPVSGSLEGQKYEQFAGSLLVLKAVADNAILTFCSSPSKLYSVILSKSYNVNETELNDIRKIFPRRYLSALSYRRYCRNFANHNIFIPNKIIPILLSVILIIIGKSY